MRLYVARLAILLAVATLGAAACSLAFPVDDYATEDAGHDAGHDADASGD